MRKRKIFLWVFSAGLLALPQAALAADKVSAASNRMAVDSIWTLLAAFLVFFMQAGFAMVESGFTRAKNAGNIMMKNLMDFCIGAIAYFIMGYAIMFGADKLGFFGTSGFMLGVDPNPSGLFPYTFWMFQVVFAATAATIVSGAMAERTRFVSYLIYSGVISALIYPVSGHWIWGSGGWLGSMGFIDFAGSTVVHSVGGWAALMGALVLGPRIGKYGPDGQSKAIPGHNIPLGALGVFILFFGWFGFNPGSTVSGTSANIATIAVTTTLAGAAGALGAMLTVWKLFGKPDTSMTLNGVLAGLVAITAGCANVSPGSAIIIGFLAGMLVVGAVEFIDKKLKVDDPVGAVAVHGVNGAFGTLMVGLFAQAKYGGVDGLLFGGGTDQFIVQLIGVASVAAWASGTTFVLFKVLAATVGLRTSREEELIGLDIEEHGMESYAGFQIFSNQ
ncbi:MAG: ammonium transporter [bacterium]